MPIPIPTKRLTKLTVAGLAVLSSVVTVLAYVFPSPTPAAQPSQTVIGNDNITVQGHGNQVQVGHPVHQADTRFLGSWAMRFTYPNSDGSTAQFEGTTEYFRNGGYNLSGHVQVASADNKAAALYAVRAGGDWQFTEGRLTFRQHELKSTPQRLSIKDKTMSVAQAETLIGRPFPNLSEEFAEGMSGEYRAVTLQPDQMTFTAIAPDGSPFQITLDRR